MLLHSLVLALAPVLAQERAAPLASGMVRSLELEPLPGTFAQYFRVDHERARPEQPPLGLLRYVAGPDREGGVQVDLELAFLADGVRVLHTEHASLTERRLVFREVREGAGRTLFLVGTPLTGFEGHELAIGTIVRHERAGSGELPLLLIEAARLGQEFPDALAVLDPLGASFETLELCHRELAGERVFEARRADGSLRWRVTSRGGEWSEWRFQELGPVARPIARAEFEALFEQHELGVRAAREAAAPAERRVLR